MYIWLQSCWGSCFSDCFKPVFKWQSSFVLIMFWIFLSLSRSPALPAETDNDFSGNFPDFHRAIYNKAIEVDLLC